MSDPRVRLLNDRTPRSPAKYVLYWAQANRRADSNHALSFAVEKSNEANLPLLVYEGLTCTYREANDRIHTFLLQGVPEFQKRVERLGAGYCFYLRERRSDANDVLYRLAADAALLVTDDYPAFIAAAHNGSVPEHIDIPYYAVDSSCIVPMSLFEKREWAAYTIRPKIHRELRKFLKSAQPPVLIRKWNGGPPEWHTPVTASNIPKLVAKCEINHSISPSVSFTGGRTAAEKQLAEFLRHRLRRYAADRNSPSNHATSEISPYLHFGQIAALEVALAAEAHAEEHKLIAAEFLEELIVRRELAFNFSRHCENPASLAALPEWAQLTLKAHAPDRREYLYSYEEFEQAGTHDSLWNACQKEMLLRGRIHGYYRMYWGKKIIEWSASPEEAQYIMLRIHDRYALDGRDPNTYTNVLWCFGLHDRPWQERPVFGTIRYMGFDGMKRKTDVPAYLREIQYLEQTGKDPFRVA